MSDVPFNREEFKSEVMSLSDDAILEQLRSEAWGGKHSTRHSIASGVLADRKALLDDNLSARREAREEDSLSISRESRDIARRSNTIAIIAVIIAASAMICQILTE